jgi:hypothetical protein
MPMASSYLVPNARFDFLLGLPEAENIGAKINEAMCVQWNRCAVGRAVPVLDFLVNMSLDRNWQINRMQKWQKVSGRTASTVAMTVRGKIY